MLIARSLILACLLLRLSLGQAETLTWAVLPLAGAAVPQVDGAGEGFVFEAQRQLEEALPELTHRHRISSVQRLDRELASGSQICSMTVLRRSARDGVAYFISYLPVPPWNWSAARAVSRVGTRGRQSPPAEAAGAAVARRHLPIRAYPPELQASIKIGITTGRIEVLSSPSPDANLMAMISHHRLDYTFEFPVVTEHFSRITPLPEPLISLPILESQELITTGLYCPATPGAELWQNESTRPSGVWHGHPNPSWRYTAPASELPMKTSCATTSVRAQRPSSRFPSRRRTR
ncbi:hypothetical protein I0E98_18820 [Pseudomonas lalucatii]|nr:hypothetical protein [Pseudomonas lalucatii]